MKNKSTFAEILRKMLSTSSTILITGAAGFIASCMASYLNKKGYNELLLMDHFDREDKLHNVKSLHYRSLINRDHIDSFLEATPEIHCIIHFGAKTDTTEMRYAIHQELNVVFSQKIWNYASTQKIPLIYASSAATYGNGEHGYIDAHDIVAQLKPLNPYGVSKNEFDLWALQQTSAPPNWYGLKFFNVFGPNEYHKGRMASVIFHAFKQIEKEGSMRLFRSHHPDYTDGGQMRDFIYVKDLLQMVFWIMEHLPENGLYNIGSGKAETFLHLAESVFKALQRTPSIGFIDTPEDIRDKYQYFTEAKMDKLRKAGYLASTYSLEDAIADYVQNYLVPNQYF